MPNDDGSGVAGERWLHADHLGSIVAMTNTSGGSPAINSYDEYGIPASTNSGRFQYTGQAWMSELGLYHYKARFYSPTLGRFLQTDPIGYDDQINLYAYVANDPMNAVDPDGQWIETIADVGFIVADAIDIGKNGLNWTNGVSLGANLLGAALPGATGLGAGTRGLMNASEKATGASVRRTYQTYTKTNAHTGKVYTGRTSGRGTPSQNVARRDQSHHKSKEGYGPAKLDKSSTDPQAIRGREQQMIERHGGAESQGAAQGIKSTDYLTKTPRLQHAEQSRLASSDHVK